jgi:hypothetical protein
LESTFGLIAAFRKFFPRDIVGFEEGRNSRGSHATTQPTTQNLFGNEMPTEDQLNSTGMLQLSVLPPLAMRLGAAMRRRW